ncbi:uncharacterized protein CG13380-like [Drosophila pseudoobscura]|uniref:Uncharacterized protein CG13380-like n=1 Tax=Drosophila pseudoobscura pseudoobscura TaxID=46245 RepID=A0A6I8VXU7_DROPS|nr:uncharacterized protein CG13380 [Drosophila pseudoobscura]
MEKGTDQNANFTRLNSFYVNLNGASLRDVSYRCPARKILGQKNNMQVRKYPFLSAENADVESKSDIVKKCICERPMKRLECSRCRRHFRGRVATICEKHPMETYLMDFRQCPYCSASRDKIKESDLTWDPRSEIRKAPDDSL